MRWRLLATAAMGALCLGSPVFAAETSAAPPPQTAEAPPAKAPSVRPSAPIRATAVLKATYESLEDMLLANDLSAVVTKGFEAQEDAVGAVAAVVVMDRLAAGRTAEARTRLAQVPERYRAGVANLLTAWILLNEDKPVEALAFADEHVGQLPSPLALVQGALIAEASGDLAEADRRFAAILATIDTRPPPDGEPTSLQDALRQIGSAQTAHILYRYAVLLHRLGKREDAKRVYDLYGGFAPNAPDLAAGLARLERGQPPLERKLDPLRGMGRWSLFVSEEFGRTQGVRRAITDPGPVKGLPSQEATLFAEAGLAFDTTAHDWALGTGLGLLDADGQAGAERLLGAIAADSPYAADAAVALAELAVKRGKNDKAFSEAQRAVRMAPARTSIALAAGGVLTRAGNQQSAIAVFSSALEKAATAHERADLLIARAAANQYFGQTDSAAADARAAVAADPRSEIKVSAIGILFEHGAGWADAVKIGRELLAGMPDSVTRLNQLGYTLIQRPEGLDEGFKLLSRGAALGQNDYAVIDSLGWAYYQYGDFGEALRLVERADELSPEPNPEILDHLGDIYWRLGQADAAKSAWERAMAAKPEALRRQRLQEKIDKGLTTPAPERRAPPSVDRIVPGERTDL